jgi:NADH dehydrogenase/NADH:ubiquinone oxidoreductase subunit G
MAVRLEELKKQRLEERSDEVQRRLEKRFRSANDDLRLDETRFQNHGCQIEREKQLIDKRRQMEQNIMEE